MNSRKIDSYSRHALARAGAVKLGSGLLVITMLVLGTQAAQAQAARECAGNLQEEPLPTNPNDLPPDLIVSGGCSVPIGTGKKYFFKQVNILSGGNLVFNEATAPAPNSQTHFWASSIIIENGGSLIAFSKNSQYSEGTPFGSRGGVLTIHLYGTNDGRGALCKSTLGSPTQQGQPPAPCGILQQYWENNGTSQVDLPGIANPSTQYHVHDYFYRYGPLHGDEGYTQNPKTGKSEQGYFGNKVLAVSYGGTLNLSGYKGSNLINPRGKEEDPVNSGWSWMRLEDGKSLNKDAKEFFLEGNPGGVWRDDDEIVVTTTDYLPGHSEKLTITGYTGGTKIPFKENIQWPHNGARYGGPNDPDHKKLTDRLPARLQESLDNDLVKNGAETRAAVALLTRSIQIVSAGEKAGQDFPKEDSGYYYGAHMVIRQGFKSVQIRGVEFRQMGQGGRLGHYPIHFHMARRTPYNTYIKDSSINESMTRWIVLHSTLGVTVARNVGYKSIGHGFYLEDGTETDNNFFSNIGIFARAAINNPQNPRKVPGIFADNLGPFLGDDDTNRGFPYRSDAEYPTVFWITNGWNDFVGNMAAGTGACGAAYWLVPFTNTDMPEQPTSNNTTVGGHMKWDYDAAGHFGYAGLQSVRDNETDTTFGGTTPLKTFYMNYATTAMMSFQTTPDAPDCNGIIASENKLPQYTNKPTISEVASNSPKPTRARKATPKEPTKPGTKPDLINDKYYPHTIGARAGTTCPPVSSSDPRPNCGTFSYKNSKPTYSNPAKSCAAGAENESNCAVTVIDHFTSSFTWAEGNIAAVWLRPQWYLLTNSVISDVQNGGLNFVTGGDFTHASTIPGLWQVAKSTIFIGHTQPQDKAHGFALDYGPFNDSSGVKCDKTQSGQGVPDYCVNTDEGISMPAGGLFTNQRLFSIYDGPNYEDSNAFLDITTTTCPIAGYQKDCMYGQGSGVGILKDPPDPTSAKRCYLPNAAIAWKQPNGFFYPPAFHSTNLYFENVDLLHYVIDPLVLAVGAAADVTISSGSPAVISWTGHGFLPGQEVYFTTTNTLPKGIDVRTTYYVIAAGLTANSFQIAATPGGAAINTSPPDCEKNSPPCPTGTRTGHAKRKYDFGQGGSYITDFWAASKDYCNAQVGMFDNFTSIDRQTELNDDDGSLTGLSNNLPNASGAIKQTISINEDKFFGATIDTPECASSIGANSKAANACKPLSNTAPPPTARTSPYDYVATVIYHPAYGKKEGEKPCGSTACTIWASDCTNPRCYGVPLYRQFLTGTNGGSAATSTKEWAQWYNNGCGTATENPADPGKKKLNSPLCRWPFIRMAGMDKAVRETLTINNGTYYLDTTVPYEMQNSEKFNKAGGDILFNTFEGGQTYYVFFVYAKKTTKQTYQIYLGTQAMASEIKPVQVLIPSAIMPKDYTGSNNFLSVDRSQAANGIVSVTVDFSSVASLLAPTRANGLCKPVRFCTWGPIGCKSALTADSPLAKFNPALVKESERVCSNWAVKDLDCPSTGCLGFRFTIPSNGFAADATMDKPTPHRPFPTSFPANGDNQGSPNWQVKFAPGSNPGQCSYPKIPGSSDCPVP
jgi:hypothetical protein